MAVFEIIKIVMIFADIKKTVGSESEWLMNLEIKAN
jgi:hypothetical protein